MIAGVSEDRNKEKAVVQLQVVCGAPVCTKAVVHDGKVFVPVLHAIK